MATIQNHSGKGGGASINGNQLLQVGTWTISGSAPPALFMNSGINGNIATPEAAWFTYRFTMNLDYDFNNDPFAAPFNITVGTILTNLFLLLHQSAYAQGDGQKWQASSAYIDSVGQTVSIANAVTVVASCGGYLFGTVTPP